MGQAPAAANMPAQNTASAAVRAKGLSFKNPFKERKLKRWSFRRLRFRRLEVRSLRSRKLSLGR